MRYDLDNDTYVTAFAVQERAVSESLSSGPGGKGWKEGEAYTLEARHHAPKVAFALNAKRGHRDDGESETFIPSGSAVRRLTPVECERLQGFPDGWTQLDDTTPDSRRYAALGDAVTVNVAYWIGRRLMGRVA